MSSVDLGVAIADESSAVAAANDKIISELPACMIKLQAAIEKMDRVLKTWFSFTSYEFTGAGGNGNLLISIDSNKKFEPTSVALTSFKDTTWSFDSSGLDTKYAISLGVSNSSAKSGQSAAAAKWTGHAAVFAALEPWTYFNQNISTAALFIKNAYEKMIADFSIDQIQDLESLTPDQQNNLIETIFAQNHYSELYTIHPGFTEFQNNSSYVLTNAFIRGDYQHSIAGQVFPDFDTSDTSPENLTGIKDDKYYYDAGVGDASTVKSGEESTVTEGSSGGKGGIRYSSGEDLKKVHPKNIFDNPNYGQYAHFEKQSTEWLEENCKNNASILKTKTGTNIGYNQGAVYEGGFNNQGTPLGPAGYLNLGVGWQHYNITSDSYLQFRILAAPEAEEDRGATQTLSGVEIPVNAIIAQSVKKSFVWNSFYGQFTCNERPEIMSWWLWDEPSVTTNGYFSYFTRRGSIQTTLNNNSQYDGFFVDRADTSDILGSGKESLYGQLLPDTAVGTNRHKVSDTAENIANPKQLVFIGGARKAIIQEESRTTSGTAGSGWDDGKLFGSNTAPVNKNVLVGMDDYAYQVNGPPIAGLVKLYNDVKQVFLQDIRDASRCILQLDIDRTEARTRLNLTARSTLANPAASQQEKEAAARAIEALQATQDDFAAGTSNFNSSLIFREQCYLMAYMVSLSAYSKASSKDQGPLFKKLPYESGAGNASLCVDADSPYAFMNALSIGSSAAEFFNMRSHDISTLQPMIKLFKVTFDESEKREYSQEIKFDSFANTSESYTSFGQASTSLLSDKNKRGFGVGIKSFDFKYAGSNPFAVKRSISAKLTIFANSFDELLRERSSDIFKDDMFVSKKYRYVDLALKTSNTGRGNGCDRAAMGEENEELAKLNFRLKVVIGWALPTGEVSHLSNGVFDALYDSFVTLNLTPTVHDFQFDDQGRVTFTIDYLAYTDDFFDQTEYNIFLNKDIAKAQLERKIKFEKFSNSCNSTALENARKAAIPDIQREKRKSVSSLIQNLLDRNLILYINAPLEGVKEFVAQGPFFDQGAFSVQPMTSEELNNSLATDISKSLNQYLRKNPDEVLSQVRAGLASTTPNSQTVAFFYLKDLCDVVLERVGAGLEQIINEIETGGAPTGLPKLNAASGASLISDAEARVEAAGTALQSSLIMNPLSLTNLGGANSLSSLTSPTALGTNFSSNISNPAGFDPNAHVPLPTETSALDTILAPPSFSYDPNSATDFSALAAIAGDTKERREYYAAVKELEKLNDDPSYLQAKIKSANKKIEATRAAYKKQLGTQDCLELANYLKLLRLQKQFQKFRLILGPVEIFDPRNDLVSRTVNFGDMPISVKYFIEFLTEKLSSKEQTIYPMANFFNDLMNSLVRNFLNDDTCFTALNSSQRVNLSNASLVGFSKDSEVDRITQIIKGTSGSNIKKLNNLLSANNPPLGSLTGAPAGQTTINQASTAASNVTFGNASNSSAIISKMAATNYTPGRIAIEDIKESPIINVSGQRAMPDAGQNSLKDEEINYMIFFAGRAKPAPGLMVGNKQDDQDRGIFHYELGREKGIVKTIQLTKTQTPGLQEVRFEQDGYDGLRQLRVVYDVNIETYANVHAYPGTYIFVNPRSFAPSSNLTPCHEFNLTEYGIGGYYMIINSEHSFGPGYANTKIFAKWVAEIDKSGARNCDDSQLAGGRRTQRCQE